MTITFLTGRRRFSAPHPSVIGVVVSVVAIGVIVGVSVAPSKPVVSSAPIADPVGQRCGRATTVRDVADPWPAIIGRAKERNGPVVALDTEWSGAPSRSALVEISLDSEHRRHIAELRGTHGPFAVSPDNGWLAVVENSDEHMAFGTELKLMSYEGSSAVDVFSAAESVSALAWAPSSDSLAFIADQRLHRFDLADRSIQEIADASSPSFARGLHRSAWSPDESWILFSTGRYDTFDRVAPDGSGRVWFAEAHSFSWSPDGSMLAFAGDGISIARPDGSGQQDLIAGPVAALSWSPDGRAIVFVSDFGYETGSVCVIESDGRLTTVASCALVEPPAWSPDSSSIVFSEVIGQRDSCDAEGDYRLSTVARHGGAVRPIAELLLYPAWLAAP